jgi:hypothetical protein
MFSAPHSSFLDTPSATTTRRNSSGSRLAIAEESIVGQMTCRPKKLFGPVAAFLNSRIGARWSQVLAELRDRLDNDSDWRRVLPQLAELVEFNVTEQDGILLHGCGLMAGQPLQSGWRRRLYVCPSSGRLKRIASSSLPATPRLNPPKA